MLIEVDHFQTAGALWRSSWRALTVYIVITIFASKAGLAGAT
jgi:hypothetical protein